MLRSIPKCSLTNSQNFPYEVREKASLFVPSIGKVTIVVLLRNLLVKFTSCSITRFALRLPTNLYAETHPEQAYGRCQARRGHRTTRYPRGLLVGSLLIDIDWSQWPRPVSWPFRRNSYRYSVCY
jgi:hypothetical protein